MDLISADYISAAVRASRERKARGEYEIDEGLRNAITAAMNVERFYNVIVQDKLSAWQRRSEEDIERSRRVCAAELQPKIAVSEETIWRHGVYVMPLMVPRERPASPDLLAITREVARSG